MTDKIVKSKLETRGRNIVLSIDRDYNPEGAEERYVVFKDELKNNGLVSDLNEIKEKINQIIQVLDLDIETIQEQTINDIDGGLWDFEDPYTADFDGGTF
jgi:hypothetical protein